MQRRIHSPERRMYYGVEAVVYKSLLRLKIRDGNAMTNRLANPKTSTSANMPKPHQLVVLSEEALELQEG